MCCAVSGARCVRGVQCVGVWGAVRGCACALCAGVLVWLCASRACACACCAGVGAGLGTGSCFCLLFFGVGFLVFWFFGFFWFFCFFGFLVFSFSF